MLLVMLLAALEKIINFAIQSDKITQLGLEPLAGKSIRLKMTSPALNLDTVFHDEGIRFEPIKDQDLFEKNSDSNITRADCSIVVDSPLELFSLISSPEGNLPIEGDYKVLMQARELMAGFDPDLVSQLEPFIGIAMASQLTQLLHHLQASITTTAKDTLSDVTDWASDISGTPKDFIGTRAEFNTLNQKLLKIRADIDREEVRLEAIKAKQEQLLKQD